MRRVRYELLGGSAFEVGLALDSPLDAKAGGALAPSSAQAMALPRPLPEVSSQSPAPKPICLAVRKAHPHGGVFHPDAKRHHQLLILPARHLLPAAPH